MGSVEANGLSDGRGYLCLNTHGERLYFFWQMCDDTPMIVRNSFGCGYRIVWTQATEILYRLSFLFVTRRILHQAMSIQLWIDLIRLQ